ncbi:MAG: trehalose-phosphatase [Bacteroidetes bacterium]|nr:trehalose-phosphatase [Bacteroidota bacterium]
MRILHNDNTLVNFFLRLRESRQSLLLLDYDGTLAPFTRDRDNAHPYPELRSVLEELLHEETCRMVIVSGRTVDDLVPLLDLDPMPELWGSHGWERLHADGTYVLPDLDNETAELLAREWEWLTDSVPHDSIERKPASVALHWRGLDQIDQVALHAVAIRRWRKLAESTRLELHPFIGGLELRAEGRSKAYAVETLLSEYQTLPVTAYLGDDLTDEEAFAALGERGLRVLVRSEHRNTVADIQLTPPGELLEFLVTWKDQLQ